MLQGFRIHTKFSASKYVLGLPHFRLPFEASTLKEKPMSGKRMIMSDASAFGFIGLGIMGNGMAANLLKGGRDLIVWNRNREKIAQLRHSVKDLKGCGTIHEAESPFEVVSSTTVTFSMLSTPVAAREIFYGSSGILKGVREGTSIVDCATLEPEDMKEFYSKVCEKGGLFLEAPVSGSKGPAESGQLVFLAAGDKAVFDQVNSELSLMGKASFFLGEIGNGTKMKLVVNMIMGTMLMSLAEGMHLANSSGLNQSELLDILDLGAMSNPMFKLKGPSMLNRKYPTAFPLKHAQKDMKFALQLAENLGEFNKLQVSSSANKLYEKAIEGFADSDFAAVYEEVIKPN